MVILHSNGFCAEHYRPVMALLAEQGIRSVAFDLPGFAGPRPEVLGWDGLIAAVEDEVREALATPGCWSATASAGCSESSWPAGGRAGDGPRGAGDRPVALAGWLAAAVYVRRVFDGTPGFTNRGPWFWRLHDPDTYDPALIALSQEAHGRADREAVAALHADLPNRYPLPFPDLPVVAVRGRLRDG